MKEQAVNTHVAFRAASRTVTSCPRFHVAQVHPHVEGGEPPSRPKPLTHTRPNPLTHTPSLQVPVPLPPPAPLVHTAPELPTRVQDVLQVRPHLGAGAPATPRPLRPHSS